MHFLQSLDTIHGRHHSNILITLWLHRPELKNQFCFVIVAFLDSFLNVRFVTYNFLSQNDWLQNAIQSQLLRNAGIGLAASVVSDTIVNAIRVVKTTKQSIGSKHDLSYGDAIRMILAVDGWKGLFGRGLRTRILANALQSIVFTIIWRGLAERWGASHHRKNTESTDSPPSVSKTSGRSKRVDEEVKTGNLSTKKD